MRFVNNVDVFLFYFWKVGNLVVKNYYYIICMFEREIECERNIEWCVCV